MAPSAILEISEGRRRKNENEKSAEVAGGTLHTEKAQFWPHPITEFLVRNVGNRHLTLHHG